MNPEKVYLLPMQIKIGVIKISSKQWIEIALY